MHASRHEDDTHALQLSAGGCRTFAGVCRPHRTMRTHVSTPVRFLVTRVGLAHPLCIYMQVEGCPSDLETAPKTHQRFRLCNTRKSGWT